jgi:transposase InsO family protein
MSLLFSLNLIPNLGDRGGEYFSNKFNLFYAEYDIIHERMLPYSPQSNEAAERKNHTLTDLINSMLDIIGLSKA